MEFLFDNPILFFIIIALISSFFKEPKGNQKKKSSASLPKQNHHEEKTYDSTPSQDHGENHDVPNRKPTIEGPFEEPEIFKIPNIFMQQFDYTAKEEEYEKKLNELEKKLSHLEKREQILKEKEAQLNDLTMRYERLSKQAQTDKAPSLDENKLVEGIIWSEILGPPRAKKSYMSAKSR